jgi:pimeloyl-ACP methyl ester carboxylesterase
MTISRRSRAGVAFAALVLASCQAGPDASQARLERCAVAGDGFVHTLFVAPGSEPRAGQPVFVFLEGDGRPWRRGGTRPATNPDPRRSVAYELVAVQQSGAFLLGRPCYHDRARDPGCEPELWTSGRYSERVVASMAAALRRAIAGRRAAPVVLVGYSGGGSLALLIADRVGQVSAVLTLAANLDLDAWTRLHGYLPLSSSLDPLATHARPPGCEIHIAAERDSVVPPSLLESAVRQRPGALLWVEPDADHACCWSARWSRIVQQVMQQLDAADCFAVDRRETSDGTGP